MDKEGTQTNEAKIKYFDDNAHFVKRHINLRGIFNAKPIFVEDQ